MNPQTYPNMSLRNTEGRRKYLTPDERKRFIETAWIWPDRDVGTLCLILAYSGCRISEALSLKVDSVDAAEACVAIRCLKKRGRIVVRTVPLPHSLIERVQGGGQAAETLLCPFSRTAAWHKVKKVMNAAGILRGLHATPKGLRHGFGIHAVRSGVPLNMAQRWLGHADIATTAIYADALGSEERELAARMWE